MVFKSTDVVNTVLETQILAINKYGEKHCMWLAPVKVKK